MSAAIAEINPEVVQSGDHLIVSIRGNQPGPTLIVLGSIHGNEPAGVLAAQRVVRQLKQRRSTLIGEVVLLAGNTRALERKVRYIDADLNRLWTDENVRLTRTGNPPREQLSELREQRELLGELDSAIARARGEVFFVDLHTTSAEGEPFATVGDTLRNRRFALNFPVTIVLGIEEQLDGPLLEHLNNRGLITMGLEAGQHDAESSIDNHEAVIWIASVAAGNLRREAVAQLDTYRSLLTRAGGGRRVVEVRYRHAISAADQFRMEPGFTNFQAVRRGQVLARDRAGDIRARETGLVLLPLYQALGDDGFFLGREVRKFWLGLSALLRRMAVGDYIHLLPGVQRDQQNENLLLVNTRIARILPLQLFHLLGFRRRRWTGNQLVVSRRAFDFLGPNSLPS